MKTLKRSLKMFIILSAICCGPTNLEFPMRDLSEFVVGESLLEVNYPAQYSVVNAGCYGDYGFGEVQLVDMLSLKLTDADHIRFDVSEENVAIFIDDREQRCELTEDRTFLCPFSSSGTSIELRYEVLGEGAFEIELPAFDLFLNGEVAEKDILSSDRFISSNNWQEQMMEESSFLDPVLNRYPDRALRLDEQAILTWTSDTAPRRVQIGRPVHINVETDRGSNSMTINLRERLRLFGTESERAAYERDDMMRVLVSAVEPLEIIDVQSLGEMRLTYLPYVVFEMAFLWDEMSQDDGFDDPWDEDGGVTDDDIADEEMTDGGV